MLNNKLGGSMIDVIIDFLVVYLAIRLGNYISDKLNEINNNLLIKWQMRRLKNEQS